MAVHRPLARRRATIRRLHPSSARLRPDRPTRAHRSNWRWSPSAVLRTRGTAHARPHAPVLEHRPDRGLGPRLAQAWTVEARAASAVPANKLPPNADRQEGAGPGESRLA